MKGYCEKCQKYVEVNTSGGEIEEGRYYWEITCAECGYLISED